MAAMPDFPQSLTEFEQRFADEDACAQYLAAARWPDGFVCPRCGGSKAWRLETKPWTYECACCGRQTSVTAGTILHHSKLPLTIWFWAAYVMATQPSGISALQLQHELGLGSYKSAWLLCAKLRRAMVAPGRPPLSGLVEVASTGIISRSKNARATARANRRHNKMLIAGAVEVQDLRVGRIRLSTVPDDSAASLHAFLAANLAPGTAVNADGGFGDCGGPGINYDLHVIGATDARKALPWVHRTFSDLKNWALGVYKGLRRRHPQSYLDEFVFRFNRRHARETAFLSLLSITAMHPPLTYEMLVSFGAAA